MSKVQRVLEALWPLLVLVAAVAVLWVLSMGAAQAAGMRECVPSVCSGCWFLGIMYMLTVLFMGYFLIKFEWRWYKLKKREELVRLAAMNYDIDERRKPK